MEWHEKSVEQVLEDLETTRHGLTQSDVEVQIKKFGRNIIPEKKKVTILQMFLEQFKSFLVIILIIAAIIAFVVKEPLDGMAIIAIVILNAIFGVVQERKAEKTLEALKKFAAPKCKVVRNGENIIIDSADIVPGDIVLLETGDKVPADCRIIEESNLKADESILTGESLPVVKTSAAIRGELPVADRKNMLFSGTTVVYGHCKAAVIATGGQTEFGKIAKVLQQREEPTPLQKKLEVLGRQLGIIIIVICAVVFIVGVSRGMDIFEVFLTAVSLAVAAVPEGLPAVVTITLAIGLMRLVKKNSIIRKLPAAETLGSTTVICADKTGTLTKNQMTVRRLYVNEKVVDVTGEGYAIEGEFLVDGRKVAEDSDIEMLLTVGMMCNNASIGKENIGDPTEIALLVAGMKFGLEDARRTATSVKEIEFDSQRKMMSIIYKLDSVQVMYTKGAVEEVLKRCTHIYKNGSIEFLRDDDKKKILDANEKFAKGALRVLAFATKKIKSKGAAEQDLMFVGLQGMMDPPRPEVKPSIERCKQAGIKVVMITGDHRVTAFAVAKELNIATDEKEVITGEELDKLNDEEFSDIVNNISVYARVSPEHKVRITEALKKRGHIVAMTGDGVNDAPALKKADIGVAMGIAGTDVAKEASDMVLTDDNFASIVSAVEEGRGIYDNIKKFVGYLLSCNVGEIIVVFAALLVSLPLPLLPLQLLWINLVTDGLPAIALGMEPYEPDIMKRKPRNPKENVLDKPSIEFILMVGVIIAAMTLYMFYLELPDVARARTMAFSALVVLEMFVAISFRSPKYLFGYDIGSNKVLWVSILASIALQFAIVYIPFFNSIFDTVPLSLADWGRLFVAAFAMLAAIELNKVWSAHRHVYKLKDVYQFMKNRAL